MSSHSDKQVWIARVLARQDTDAFARLVAECQGQVRTFLVRLCRNYDIADDLAQETFVVAYQKLGSFRGSGSFDGWLFRIAYHRFLQYMRDDRRKQEVLEHYGRMLEVEADRYETISDSQVDLERAMSVLNQDEAAAVTLCLSFGFSHGEAAGILNAPLGSVKSRISRGKEKLKAALMQTPGQTTSESRDTPDSPLSEDQPMASKAAV